jgi:hypothetical protein
MKDILKKVFEKKISTSIAIGLGTFSIFTFIVFPGLTEANTIVNLLSALLGVFTLVFIFHYLKSGDEELEATPIEPGETELDYVSEEDLKPKKKTVVKKAKKSEYPLPPHHPVPKTKAKPKSKQKSKE